MGDHLERGVGSDWVGQGKVRVADMNARVKHTEGCLCTANMCRLAYAIKRYYKECASAHISSLSAARLWPDGVKRGPAPPGSNLRNTALLGSRNTLFCGPRQTNKNKDPSTTGLGLRVHNTSRVESTRGQRIKLPL